MLCHHTIDQGQSYETKRWAPSMSVHISYAGDTVFGYGAEENGFIYRCPTVGDPVRLPHVMLIVDVTISWITSTSDALIHEANMGWLLLFHGYKQGIVADLLWS